jgi:hypothetical protein
VLRFKVGISRSQVIFITAELTCPVLTFFQWVIKQCCSNFRDYVRSNMDIISSSEMDGEMIILHHSKVLLWYLVREAKENHDKSVGITVWSMYIHPNRRQRHYFYR